MNDILNSFLRFGDSEPLYSGSFGERGCSLWKPRTRVLRHKQDLIGPVESDSPFWASHFNAQKGGEQTRRTGVSDDGEKILPKGFLEALYGEDFNCPAVGFPLVEGDHVGGYCVSNDFIHSSTLSLFLKGRVTLG